MTETLSDRVRAYRLRHPLVSVETVAYFFGIEPTEVRRILDRSKAYQPALTGKQRERAKVMRSEGMSNAEIALRLGVHKETVRRHLTLVPSVREDEVKR